MSLQEMVEYVDIASKILTSAAIVIGGIWALRRFHITREGIWNLQLDVSSTDAPYAPNLRLLLIEARMKNIGKVKVTREKKEKGCTVEIVKFDRALPSGQIFNWTAGTSLLEETDILKQFPQYEIEPGAEYRERLGLVVPEDSLLMIRTVFASKGDEITDYFIFQTGKNDRQSTALNSASPSHAPQDALITSSPPAPTPITEPS